MSNSCMHGRHLGQSGFLLLFLVPMLGLLSLFFAGSLNSILRAQERDALQSRLDACAVRLAVAREQLLERLVSWNLALLPTVKGIYLARGIKVMGGPPGAVAGGAAEAALLALNRSLAGLQDLALAAASLQESLGLFCPRTAFSRGLATCQLSPAAGSAVQRMKTLFSDVRGAVVHREVKEALALVSCSGHFHRGAALRTRLRIRGDSTLLRPGFRDSYEE